MEDEREGDFTGEEIVIVDEGEGEEDDKNVKADGEEEEEDEGDVEEDDAEDVKVDVNELYSATTIGSMLNALPSEQNPERYWSSTSMTPTCQWCLVRGTFGTDVMADAESPAGVLTGNRRRFTLDRSIVDAYPQRARWWGRSMFPA